MLLNFLCSVLPLIGIIGYFVEVEWLYLVFTIISVVCNVILMLSGAFHPRSIILLIIACVIAGIATESFWEGILLGNAFFIAGNNIIFLIIAIFTSIFSKDKKIDPWRMECRTAFESAAQEIKNSPLGNYGFSTLAIGPRLGEVKEQLYEKVMWENKSQEILDEEFQRAIKKYIG